MYCLLFVEIKACLARVLTNDLTLVHNAVNLLDEARASASKNLWWPFTQHATVLKDNVTVIDYRCGEHLAVYQPGSAADSQQQPKLQMQYDACASWWTQARIYSFLLGLNQMHVALLRTYYAYVISIATV